jgi:hypothetical protein
MNAARPLGNVAGPMLMGAGLMAAAVAQSFAIAAVRAATPTAKLGDLALLVAFAAIANLLVAWGAPRLR